MLFHTLLEDFRIKQHRLNVAKTVFQETLSQTLI